MPNSLIVLSWISGALMLVLAGCSSGNSTRLHDLEAPSKSVMSSAEQERAIKEMLARKEAQQSKMAEEPSKAK